MPRTWEQLRASSKLTQAQLESVDATARAEVERMRLPELRKARRLSQQAVADRLDIQQGEVSRMERRADLYLRTLRSYIEAAGGRLRLIAEFPDAPAIEIEGLGDIATLAVSNVSHRRSARAAASGKRRRSASTPKRRAAKVVRKQ
jgi:transcriptional regulator with XRE-family HTH domain